jgi:hypothetical protein
MEKYLFEKLIKNTLPGGLADARRQGEQFWLMMWR